jgi:hypothetical protein
VQVAVIAHAPKLGAHRSTKNGLRRPRRNSVLAVLNVDSVLAATLAFRPSPRHSGIRPPILSGATDLSGLNPVVAFSLNRKALWATRFCLCFFFHLRGLLGLVGAVGHHWQ